MPPRFLRPEARATYLQFPSAVEEGDLITHFLLTPTDLEQVKLNRTATQRMGFAVLLCGLRYLGFFPHDLATVPDNVTEYLAEQLGCDPASLLSYGQRLHTRQEHQRVIMAYLGFRWLGEEAQATLVHWLSQRALENDRPSTLLQQASEWLYKERLVRPGITLLEELVLASRQTAHTLTYEHMVQSLHPDLETRLDHLLQPDLQRGVTPLSWLRRPALGYGAKDILQALEKLQFIQTWAIDDWPLTRLPPARIQHLVQMARRSSNQALQRKPELQRYPLLMAFVADARAHLTDEILDLYDQRIAQTERDARRDWEAHRLRVSDALQRTAWYFGQIVPTLLDEAVPDVAVRSEIFAMLPREQLEGLLTSLLEQQQLLDKIHFLDTRYAYLRQFLPTLLATLTFQAYQAPDSLLQAIHRLKDIQATYPTLPKYLEAVPTDFVPADWRRHVINRDGTVNRRGYELCVMWVLRDALRSGRIWVEHSRRYTHLDTYLMPTQLWQDQRNTFFELVPIEPVCDDRLQHLHTQLALAFETLHQQLPHDEALRLEDDRLVLTPYQGQADPTPLAEQIQRLLPHLQLPELLYEVDTWLNFSQHLHHAANATVRIDQLDRHLYAVILAQARNIDFKQMVDVVDLSYRQMLWCNTWYVRAETLQQATNVLVNYQYQQPLSHYWGDGRFSSSDGQRFAVAVPTQNATPLPRYFGYGRGLTFLTWTSNQYSQYGTLVTPPTAHEAAYTLDKILDNESDLDIQEHTTDTEGYTDLIFALFDLLGIQFAPRIKDISDTRLYGIRSDPPYPHLQALITRHLDLRLIQLHWDDMLRLAASLKFRWVTPSLIIRKLQAFPRQHPLAQALQEYGRLVKTIFILRYFISEAYRRHIGAQLNKSEQFHTLRAHLHSANRGFMRKKFPEEHLNQANCLNLVVNAIAVWNTVYMQAALHYLRQSGQVISEDELVHLSPVRFEHINIYGKYSFDISEPLAEDGLRPLAIPT